MEQTDKAVLPTSVTNPKELREWAKQQAVTGEGDAPRVGQWWSGKIAESDVDRIVSYLEQCSLKASNRNIAFQHCKETLAGFKDETAIAFYNLLDAAIGF